MSERKLLIIFFALSYLISWVIWLPLYLPSLSGCPLPMLPYHHAIGALGPFLAAFITAYISGGEAFKKLLNGLFKWNVPVYCYIIAFLSPFIILLVASVLGAVINDIPFTLTLPVSDEYPEFGFVSFFLYNFISFGIGEETGWRGYVVPKFQKKMSNLKASIVLAILWAGWHIPLFLYRPGYVSMDIAGISGWFISIVTGSVILTWLFNKSKGSILIVAIFHATIDMPFMAVNSPILTNYIGAIITIWGLFVAGLMYKEDGIRKIFK